MPQFYHHHVTSLAIATLPSATRKCLGHIWQQPMWAQSQYQRFHFISMLISAVSSINHCRKTCTSPLLPPPSLLSPPPPPLLLLLLQVPLPAAHLALQAPQPLPLQHKHTARARPAHRNSPPDRAKPRAQNPSFENPGEP
jgi:hypothetical protein